MSLQRYPPEVIAKALSHLDGYSLAKCRQVCHHLSKIIKSEVRLQYTLELCKSGMVDAPDSFEKQSIQERLDILREFIARRQNRAKTQNPSDVIITLPEDFRKAHHSGLFVSQRETENEVGLVDVSNLVPTGSKAERVFEERRMTVDMQLAGRWDQNQICVDRDQDLIIILSGSYQEYRQGLRFHLFSLSNGATHPLATLPFISWDDIAKRPGRLVFQIFDDLFVVCEYTACEGPALIYNWKTGHRLLEFIDEAQAFVLFDSEHFMTCTWGAEDQCELQVREIETSKIVVRLSLPRMLQKDEYFAQAEHFVQLLNGALPLPSRSTLSRQRRYPFHASPEAAIITLWIQNPTSDFITTISHSDLLNIMHTPKSSTDTNAISLSWGTWPQATFQWWGNHQPQRISVYGRRLAIAADDDVKIFEFDNRWFKDSYATRQVDDVSFTCVHRPRLVRWIDAHEWIDDIFLDEDFVVVVVRSGMTGRPASETCIYCE
ncbi:hypothetical protein BDN72DRAFT_964904 [Pluteus cervinus]|uniref:Uncharacterized protein n=1 Tax=Pluteus cervinus TaxID=181527 RepID=A0ACD3A8Z1_9AGAR|nr:hypothetical protein BDN72DRAFT_964904 [Pluteus cervinus]